LRSKTTCPKILGARISSIRTE